MEDVTGINGLVSTHISVVASNKKTKSTKNKEPSHPAS